MEASTRAAGVSSSALELTPLGKPQRVHLLINPASGKDQPILATLHRVLMEQGIRWGATILEMETDLKAELARILDGPEPPDWVVVSGGDGTVSSVADAMAGRDTPLAILPGGTGNVVAQELGLPLDYEAAAQMLFGGSVTLRTLDLIDANGTTCILRAGLGADARMMESANADAKSALGWAAYVRAAVEQVAQEDLTRIKLRYNTGPEGEAHELDCEVLTMLVLNISRLGRGGAVLSEDIRPDDGWLDVLLVKSASAPAIMTVLRSLFSQAGSLPQAAPGQPGDPANPVEHFRAKEVSVQPSTSLALQIDGDIRPHLEPGSVATFSIRSATVTCVSALA